MTARSHTRSRRQDKRRRAARSAELDQRRRRRDDRERDPEPLARWAADQRALERARHELDR